MRWPTDRFALSPETDKDMGKTYHEMRSAGRIAIRMFLLVLVSFAIILCSCVFMAGLQQRSGFFLQDVVWWKRMGQNGVEVTNSGASILTMTTPNVTQSPDLGTEMLRPNEGGHYAVCGHTWHGLQLVDYAFFSLVSYMNPIDKNELPQLLSLLFPHMQVKLKQTPKGHRKWLEIEVETCPKGSWSRTGCRAVTVIAVSGTDPTRIMDYAENLRMWTDPVCIQILSTVFPTVRIWPRETTAMIIRGVHGMLKRLAVQDDQWHYSEILDHVRKIPYDREVVLTGHSLGGGIALVVGALTGRLAVAIQPPGVYHSLAKHQLQQRREHARRGGSDSQALHKRSVSLVFEGDWIQNFDNHGGLVQTMMCDQSDKNIAVGCHLLEGAIKHLLRHCGDQAQRFTHCKHTYTPVSTAVDVVKWIIMFLQGHWQIYRSGWSGIPQRLGSLFLAGCAVSTVAITRHGMLPRSWLAQRMREMRRKQD